MVANWTFLEKACACVLGTCCIEILYACSFAIILVTFHEHTTYKSNTKCIIVTNIIKTCHLRIKKRVAYGYGVITLDVECCEKKYERRVLRHSVTPRVLHVSHVFSQHFPSSLYHNHKRRVFEILL